jgi:hypothetical protein
VYLFEPDQEHWAVGFLKNRPPHLDGVIGPNGQEEAVERGMMQLTKREAVADDRVAFVFSIRDNVGSVEEFAVAKPAQRTLFSVGIQNLFAKSLLMKPPAERRSHIFPSNRGAIFRRARLTTRRFKLSDVVDRHVERKSEWVVPDDVHRPRGQVVAGTKAVEENEGNLALQR